MNPELIQHFLSVTGSESSETARFYIESAKNDVDVAIGMYMDNALDPSQAPGTSQGASTGAPSGAAGGDGVARNVTLSDGDKRDEERWYTGGGAGSGQEVIAPGRNDGPDVNAFFEALRPHARDGTAADVEGPQGSFTGSARTLDGQVRKAKDTKKVVIRFYANEVFTVDNGPPRSIHDPASAAFIESIRRQECPPELAAGTDAVDISIMQLPRNHEPSDQAPQAFAGRGQKLGVDDASTSAAASRDAATPLPAWTGPDDSRDVTSIQIRLPDGSRLVGRFNHEQPVHMIRAFVRTARPDVGSACAMVAGFPQKAIEDETQSIVSAGLVNSVVIFK